MAGQGEGSLRWARRIAFSQGLLAISCISDDSKSGSSIFSVIITIKYMFKCSMNKPPFRSGSRYFIHVSISSEGAEVGPWPSIKFKRRLQACTVVG
jgi:hypothetical protein